MDELSERLSKLGAAVARADAPDAGAIADARRRLARDRRARRGRRSVAPVVAITAVALLGLGGALAVRSWRASDEVAAAPPPISFVVGAARDQGRVGQWIAGTETPTPVRFTEGTAVTVGADTRARVSGVSAGGASVDLERGSLRADVVHRDASEWSFRAGPYTVRVTGTRFDLAWDAASEQLTLRMHEGSVEVSGSDLARPQAVVAGQTLRASHRDGRIEIRRASEEPRDAERAGGPTGERDGSGTSAQAAHVDDATGERDNPRTERGEPARADDATGDADERDGAAARGDGSGEPEWRALLERGTHAAAIEAAERHGFNRVLLSAEPSDLYRLADAARLVGRPERARDALVALRTRHGERGRTAFLLGRLAHEAGDRADAIHWLETYLDESPGGALEEGALGRLIELERASDPVSARARAERYLARHPHGAYAELARSVLSR